MKKYTVKVHGETYERHVVLANNKEDAKKAAMKALAPDMGDSFVNELSWTILSVVEIKPEDTKRLLEMQKGKGEGCGK